MNNANERSPEVGAVAYMPGVYKIYMVRMAEMPDELANVRVYTEERIEMYAGLKK